MFTDAATLHSFIRCAFQARTSEISYRLKPDLYRRPYIHDGSQNVIVITQSNVDRFSNLFCRHTQPVSPDFAIGLSLWSHFTKLLTEKVCCLCWRRHDSKSSQISQPCTCILIWNVVDRTWLWHWWNVVILEPHCAVYVIKAFKITMQQFSVVLHTNLPFKYIWNSFYRTRCSLSRSTRIRCQNAQLNYCSNRDAGHKLSTCIQSG